jgi:choline kinase
MVHSLFLAKKLLANCKTIVLYGDIAISKRDLSKLVFSNKDFELLFDLDWKRYWLKRFENPLEDLESFHIKNGLVKKIGGKVRNLSQIEGQYIGAFSLSPLAASTFFKTWRSMENRDKVSVTEVISKIIENKSLDIYGTPLDDPWLEIDFPQDFEIAKKIIMTIPTE